MSFYQPSLSLYDVLNALNSQAPARDPREQLFRNQGYVQKPPVYRPYGAGCPVGLPAGLLYRLPGDTCYYRPNYYYTGEDEDDEGEAAAEAEAEAKAEADAEAEEEAEELEEAERAERAARAERAERAQQEASYGQLPSYYHSRAPKGGIQDNYEEADPVSDMLTALLGGTPAYVQAPPQPPSRRSTSAADDLVKQALLEKLGLAQDYQEEKPEDGSQVTGSEEKPDELLQQPNKPKEKLPFPLNRKQPSQNRSSVPDPLQVSKPEARLDLPFSPELNVYDCPDQYVVAVALPGATSKAFKVDYHPSTHELILKGDVEDKLGISEDYLKVTELKYGAFQRTIKFPIVPRIKDEEIKASYKNGILQVKIPKILGESEKPAPKKRIVIEDVPDEELEYEEHPALSL
ncbi:HSP42 (YDR171W) [Zygosaccharomyces parabailii]|nr:HSP42 (YDR171W) [Zygosaccharomyces parabailii]CDH10492.1 related to Heat shock protein 42 [Zygosaccharomyces bailii ISA1307]